MTGTIRRETDGLVATVTIDNPEKRNALSPPLIERLIGAFDAFEGRDDIRTVVLTGVGEKAFSSGFDVSYFEDGSDDEGADWPTFVDLIETVSRFEYPVIAMINGSAYGGAVSLVAACDLRIAVEDAAFAITPATLGHIYTSDGIFEVMNHIGAANIKELLFTAEPIDSRRAFGMGLLNDVVERAELEERTYGMAERVSSNAPLSLVGMKKIVRAHLEHGSLTEAEREWAAALREEAMESRDHREGVEAFRENRQPEFEGR